jgi:hypothetical protein
LVHAVKKSIGWPIQVHFLKNKEFGRSSASRELRPLATSSFEGQKVGSKLYLIAAIAKPHPGKERCHSDADTVDGRFNPEHWQ